MGEEVLEGAEVWQRHEKECGEKRDLLGQLIECEVGWEIGSIFDHV